MKRIPKTLRSKVKTEYTQDNSFEVIVQEVDSESKKIVLMLDLGEDAIEAQQEVQKKMKNVDTSDKLEIGDVPFISHNSKPTKSEALEYYRRVVSSWKLDINLYEEVNKITKKENFEVVTSKGKYISKNVVKH